MIIRGGENIYPREIENFLYGMEQIEAIEVAGIPVKNMGKKLAPLLR